MVRVRKGEGEYQIDGAIHMGTLKKTKFLFGSGYYIVSGLEMGA